METRITKEVVNTYYFKRWSGLYVKKMRIQEAINTATNKNSIDYLTAYRDEIETIIINEIDLNNMRKITGVVWFGAGETAIGIVTTISEPMNEKRAYIGIGKGIDQVYDMEFIAYWGAKFPIEEAETLVKSKGMVTNHILKVDRSDK